MAGLTEAGLTIKNTETLKAELDALLKAKIDPDLNVEADSVAGQITGTVAATLQECWELLATIYQTLDPDTATGQALSRLAANTGTLRADATKATANIQCTFTGTPTIPVGTVIYVDGDPDSRFELLTETVTTGSPEKILFTAVDEGAYPTIATTDTLVIETPGDLTTATLALTTDFTAGTDVETDAELRTRRLRELFLPGTGTVGAIEADLLNAKTALGIVNAKVFENATGVTVDGMPPHSIEVIVQTGATFDEDALGQKIWDIKPAGIEAYGSDDITTVEDSTQTVSYTPAVTKTLYIKFSITTDANSYAGDDAVKSAIVEWANANLTLGSPVYGSKIAALTSGVDGVVDVDLSTVLVDDVVSPLTTDYIPTGRHLPVIESGNITITVL